MSLGFKKLIEEARAAGYDQQVNQALYNYLGSLGVTGSLNERIIKRYTGGALTKSISQFLRETPSTRLVTESLSAGTDWTNQTTASTLLSYLPEGSILADIEVSDTDTGIILESGGSSLGLALYVYNGQLVFTCGDGKELVGSEVATVEYTLPTGTSRFTVEVSATEFKCAMFINGTMVDLAEFDANGNLSGSDDGGVLSVHASVRTTRGGWSTDGSGVFTGTLHKCTVWPNEVVPELDTVIPSNMRYLTDFDATKPTYIRLANAITFPRTSTWELYIRAAVSADGAYLAADMDNNDSESRFGMLADGRTFGMSNDSDNINGNTNGKLGSTKLQSFVARGNGTNVGVYVRDELENFYPIGSVAPVINSFGRQYAGTTGVPHLAGIIEEIRVVIDGVEKLHLKLDDKYTATNNIIPDLSGNGNDGTLNYISSSDLYTLSEDGTQWVSDSKTITIYD